MNTRNNKIKSLESNKTFLYGDRVNPWFSYFSVLEQNFRYKKTLLMEQISGFEVKFDILKRKIDF